MKLPVGRNVRAAMRDKQSVAARSRNRVESVVSLRLRHSDMALYRNKTARPRPFDLSSDGGTGEFQRKQVQNIFVMVITATGRNLCQLQLIRVTS
ncbi:hypothetical protein [Roseibium sp. MMSF_3544]|uniref:hypothetical protein n=1 Tax=unclassified Roseibium TaxID=2629323 RepID=UPI00273FF945|nr:hypothetical protein [Roseibium sp. MMSF_3544]